MATQATRDFTSGPLSRVATAVYNVLGPTAGFLVACLPFAITLIASKSPVVWAAGGVVVGPAWAALLYATRVLRAEPDRGPFRAFWHGYRLNAAQGFLVWVPYWALFCIAAADVVAPAASPVLLRVVIAILAAVSMLWMSAVLLVISRYAFRTRDVLRLGLYVMTAAPRSTFTNAALLLVAGGVIYLGSEFVLALFAGVFALFAIGAAKGAFELLDARFTASASTL